VRRAPGWKGAPEWHAAKILSMSFSLRCHRRKFCVKFCHAKNPQKELASNGVPEWLPLSVTDYTGDSGHSLVDSSTVAENSESWLTCLCSVVTYGVGCTSILGPAGPGPNILQRDPSINPPMIMLQRAIKTLKCITNFTWSTIQRLSTVATVLLMNFWSCKLANLRNQKSFSCADNGSIAHICIEGL